MRKISSVKNSKNPIIKTLTTRKIRVKRLIILSLVLLVTYIYGFGDYGISRYLHLRQEYKTMCDEIALLEAESEQLKHEETLLVKKDPEYLQKIAREKFGLVKAGEKIYKLVPKSGSK